MLEEFEEGARISVSILDWLVLADCHKFTGTTGNNCLMHVLSSRVSRYLHSILGNELKQMHRKHGEFRMILSNCVFDLIVFYPVYCFNSNHNKTPLSNQSNLHPSTPPNPPT